MRSIHLARELRELTYDGFIETYGKVPVSLSEEDIEKVSKISARRFSIKARQARLLVKQSFKTVEVEANVSSDSNNNNSTDQQERDTTTLTVKESNEEKMSSIPAYKKLRKISLRKKENSSPSEPKSSSLHRSKSVSFLAKSSVRRSNWLSGISPSFYRRTERKVATNETSQVPMSKMNSAAHRGFLSKRNEKKQKWERFWCILQDSCLYCYSSTDSEFADDVISLGGYYVTVNEGRPQSLSSIVLERPGRGSYELKGDDIPSLNSWVHSLRRNLGGGNRKPRGITRSASTVTCISPIKKQSLENSMGIVEVKAKLLREVLDQQQEILKEQKMLEKMRISRQTSAANSPAVIHKRGKSPSLTSLAHSEDTGYSSSFDGSMCETFSEYEDVKQDLSTSARSCRSMSTVSVLTTSSLGSIAEERKNKSTVSPKILAEIEEFREFSKRTIEKRCSSED